MESLECPLSATTLTLEVPTLGGRGNWTRLGGPIAVVSEVSGMLDWSSSWGGDGGVNVSG